MKFSRLSLVFGLAAVGLALGGCSSSPYAPINQVTPIKQMDQFFAYWNTPKYPANYVERRCECRCCER